MTVVEINPGLKPGNLLGVASIQEEGTPTISLAGSDFPRHLTAADSHSEDVIISKSSFRTRGDTLELKLLKASLRTSGAGGDSERSTHGGREAG